MKTLTPEQALALVNDHIKAAGSQSEFARQNNFSPQYVTDVQKGRIDLSNAKMILNAVGLTRRVVYTAAKKRKDGSGARIRTSVSGTKAPRSTS